MEISNTIMTEPKKCRCNIISDIRPDNYLQVTVEYNNKNFTHDLPNEVERFMRELMKKFEINPKGE